MHARSSSQSSERSMETESATSLDESIMSPSSVSSETPSLANAHSSPDELDVSSESSFSGLSSHADVQSSDHDSNMDEAEDENTTVHDHETKEMFAIRLANLLRKMMFVSGETAEPSVETTTLIEDIVRQQVVEIVCHASLCTAPITDHT